MLNSIGLANIGIDAFIAETMPRLRELDVTVIVNTFATSVEDFVELARRFDEVEGIAALELNISCPNVHAGGMHFGVSGAAAREVTAAVRAATSLPLMVKLSPEAGDICEVARAVEDGGADIISMINTIDVDRRRPMLGQKMGGMSGPALKPLAVRMVYEVYQQVSIPIIGMGGISCLRDALEFFMAGSAAVQVGTANYAEPGISLRLAVSTRSVTNRPAPGWCPGGGPRAPDPVPARPGMNVARWEFAAPARNRMPADPRHGPGPASER